jgi:hypothetical protein
MTAHGRKGDELTSGFVRLDFILTFAVGDAATRQALAERCEGEWGGTRVGESTWEIATGASPDAFELEIEPFLRPGDRAVFYYLAESKRFFRVVVSG